MATQEDIASLALTRIGHEGVTSFSASGNKAQRWFNSSYDLIRKSILREHGWRMAKKRAVLTQDTIRTITAITNANPGVVTSASHGFSNGDRVFISGVIGMTQVNDLQFPVANVATNTFELDVDTSAYSAYSSGGLAYGYVPTDYPYRYALPSDCLRILKVNGKEELTEYSVEAGYLYTDDTNVQVEYVFDNQDESSFDDQFVDVLAARLSAEIAFYLTSNSQLTEQAWDIYNKKIAIARSMDSRQGTPDSVYADNWLLARY